MTKACLGIIGGSGLYEIGDLSDLSEVSVETPFGEPSDKIVTGKINGTAVAFLSRHGRGHRLLPSEVNYRANIYALKKIGVTHILSVSAVGSLREDLMPGMVVVPDQVIDRTGSGRARSFFGEGLVGHVAFADPFCVRLRKKIAESCHALQIPFYSGGALVVIEGPRFSSRGESELYRSTVGDIIGMTAMPEAALAREAEIPYATAAMVTDYDCWRVEEEGVDAHSVIATLKANVEKAKRLISELSRVIHFDGANPIRSAAATAIITAREAVPSATLAKVNLLFGKYLSERK